MTTDHVLVPAERHQHILRLALGERQKGHKARARDGVLPVAVDLATFDPAAREQSLRLTVEALGTVPAA